MIMKSFAIFDVYRGPVPKVQVVERPFHRGKGGRRFDTRPRHTKGVKMYTRLPCLELSIMRQALASLLSQLSHN